MASKGFGLGLLLWLLCVMYHVQLAQAVNACGTGGVCTCSGTNVNCEGKSLTTIPSAIPVTTTFLELQTNNITSISASAFTGLTALTYLRLNENQLASVPANSFTGLTALNYLRLNDNQLTSISANAFAGLTALTVMGLNRNQITSISAEALAGVAALKRLDLSFNEITFISATAFVGLTALTGLALHNNQITSISTNAWAGLELEYLILSDNPLTTLPPGLFMGLPNGLYLSVNSTTNILKYPLRPSNFTFGGNTVAPPSTYGNASVPYMCDTTCATCYASGPAACCARNCLVCNSSTVCTQCYEGYGMLSGSCIPLASVASVASTQSASAASRVSATSALSASAASIASTRSASIASVASIASASAASTASASVAFLVSATSALAASVASTRSASIASVASIASTNSASAASTASASVAFLVSATSALSASAASVASTRSASIASVASSASAKSASAASTASASVASLVSATSALSASAASTASASAASVASSIAQHAAGLQDSSSVVVIGVVVALVAVLAILVLVFIVLRRRRSQRHSATRPKGSVKDAAGPIYQETVEMATPPPVHPKDSSGYDNLSQKQPEPKDSAGPIYQEAIPRSTRAHSKVDSSSYDNVSQKHPEPKDSAGTIYQEPSGMTSSPLNHSADASAYAKAGQQPPEPVYHGISPTSPQVVYDNESVYLAGSNSRRVREGLTIVKHLASGNFGDVSLGQVPFNVLPPRAQTLLGPVSSETVQVAVKSLKSDADKKSRQDFESEAKLMAPFVHPNVVRLLAALVASEPHLVLLEFVQYGDLRTLLQKSKLHSLWWTQNEQVHAIRQIAFGMEYLGTLHFVHRDLAARNCLVGQGMVVKIADFGLSRELADENDYYRMQTRSKLPVKWMAPETMTFRKFSTMSDVWSFGVTAWECSSYGATPYGMLKATETLAHVEAGGRLPMPETCMPELYHMMMSCWNVTPEFRPSFSQLVKGLKNFDDGTAVRDIGAML